MRPVSGWAALLLVTAAIGVTALAILASHRRPAAAGRISAALLAGSGALAAVAYMVTT